MTGALMAAASIGESVQLQPTTISDVGSGVGVRAEWIANSDGTVDYNRTAQSDTIGAYNWASPSGPGGYEIRATKTGGEDPSGDSLATWLALTSTRSWFFQRIAPNPGTNNCSLTVEIRLGSTVLASETISLAVDNT